jgi:hypothetical protein
MIAMMFSAIRIRLTYANVVVTLALVFAMSGGAYAVSGGDSHASGPLSANAAKKKSKAKAPARGPAGPKGATGAAGPAGPAGPAGAAGAKGENGAAGSNGANGTDGTDGENGKGVKTSTFAAGATEPAGANCEEAGGTSVEVEGSGAKHFVCNGKEGAKGPEGNIQATLPSGKTETGVWQFQAPTNGRTIIAISFSIPLAGEGLPEGRAHFVSKEDTENEVEVPGCGKATREDRTHPTAEKGNLCIYATSLEDAEIGEEAEEKWGFANPCGCSFTSVGAAGEMLRFTVGSVKGTSTGETGGEGSGTWAVTAE